MTSISNIWKQLTSILSNLNNFHPLEVVDRVSEAQLQVGENSDWIIWRLKGLGLSNIIILLVWRPQLPVCALIHHAVFYKSRRFVLIKVGVGTATYESLVYYIMWCFINHVVSFSSRWELGQPLTNQGEEKREKYVSLKGVNQEQVLQRGGLLIQTCKSCKSSQ